MNYLVYKFFVRFFLTRDFTKKIELRMSLLYPGPRRYVVNKTSKEIIRIVILSIASVLGIILFADFSFYYSVIAIVMAYVLSTSYIYKRFDQAELKLLSQLEQFITDVRYRFKFDGMVEEALEDAINTAEYEMSLHGNVILSNLRENMGKMYDNPYKEYAPSHFFLTFYIMCETVMIYGDKMINGQSMFLKNISYLKEDIHNEILRRKKINGEFMGLFGVIVLPVFAIKPIEIWGEYNMSELAGEYEGVKGAIVTLILVFITVMVYMVTRRLKYPAESIEYKNSLITTICKSRFVDKAVLRFISINYKKCFILDKKLKEIVYKYNVKEFIVMRWVYSLMAANVSLLLGISIGLGIFAVVAFITAFLITYYGIYLSVLFRQQMMLLDREEEVVRFQTIILILMHMDRISLERILEHMEAFAVVFKDTIARISDQLAYKGKKILTEVKDEVSFAPFERMLDAFIASDVIGISSAFEDIEADRKYYVEKHKQENEEIAHNKALIAKFIAFVPLCLVILFKLILPFVLMGIKQLSEFNM